MFKYLANKIRELQNERGQVLVLGVLFIGVLCAGAAIAVDAGSYMSHRRSLQNHADAIALAASQGLPNASDAQDLAEEWATLNGVDMDNMTVTVTPQNLPSEPNPKVQVELADDHELSFMRVFGMASAEVGATATGVKTSPGGGDGLMPWSVKEEDKNNAVPGQSLVLKYDANNPQTGNFGPLRIDGNGSNVYRDTIINGSNSVYCAAGVPDCDAPSVANTETGNMTGPTRQGTDYRINNTSAACDTWEEAIIENADGTHTINPACNPFNGNDDSKQIIIIPVINDLCNGNCQVTILEFAMFYLEGYGDGGCTGNDCEIMGRYINSNTNMGALMGVFNEDTFVHFVRLVE